MSDTATSLLKWDVFLSFRGLDTRHNFISFLYNELVRWEIRTFKDDKELESGQPISQELKRAIEVSEFAIVVVSVNYAASTWCLDELVNIMELQNKKSITVIPIFYGVDPAHLRRRKGEVAEQFKKHESREDHERVESWKQALTNLADISGYCSSQSQDESVLVNEITARILKKPVVVPKGSNGSTLVDEKRRCKEKVKSLRASMTKLANLSNHDKVKSCLFESSSLSFSSSCSITPRQFEVFVSFRSGDTHHQFSLHGDRSRRDLKIHGSYSTQS